MATTETQTLNIVRQSDWIPIDAALEWLADQIGELAASDHPTITFTTARQADRPRLWQITVGWAEIHTTQSPPGSS